MKITNEKVLIIIPAYNEEGAILNVTKELKEKSPSTDFIVINDCSTDTTEEILTKNKIPHLTHEKNKGLFGTMTTGFNYANENGYDAVIQLDGDGQHDPAEISKIVNIWKEKELDFVQGSRFIETKKPFTSRMMGSRVISLFFTIVTFKRIKDPTNGMRLYGKCLIERFANDSKLHPEPDTIAYLIKDKYKFEEVQVNVRERETGESYLTSFRIIKYMSKTVSHLLFKVPFMKKVHKKELKKLMKLKKNSK
ncbi:glycosyltransferase family 2 protein [Mycoplasma marinum]|uniref:Glycosyl transferase family 2 n=1 Tax=Mycoplasma marinum TaxID=1937190 RepID=A0A4R0XT19_9MOLU|nr:glycosyltransferase family 2 protein [Mycoplasma marinum]TCG10759.1 glycosyl transferase family 2 [Mycoplasma marinum]